MTNPLEELKALVDAAAGPLILDTDANGLTNIRGPDYDDGSGVGPVKVHVASYLTTDDAKLFLASVNIAKRLTDEAWESKAIRAMAESQAVDDEGPFPFLCDLLDFSGENKRVTVLRAAWRAALAVLIAGEEG